MPILSNRSMHNIKSGYVKILRVNRDSRRSISCVRIQSNRLRSARYESRSIERGQRLSVQHVRLRCL